ncbi:MAG: TIGR02206 family membrane protein [Lactobacillaceae bacterium]|jgi:hypothetical integral membrane protein (TIGR02206 family)|nr:TIGR02206 family membrane protein [Lactobacillaceae bacterium]
MFKYLITYKNNMPAGHGFQHFSIFHLTWLLVLACLIYVLVTFYQRSDQHRRQTIRRTIAAIIVSLELMRDTILVASHQFTMGEFPFHLCGIGIFIIAWDAIRPNHPAREILYSLNIWGAFAALLFPDWTMFPLFNVFLMQSFIIHSLLITYPMMLLVSGEFRPNWRKLWQPMIYLVIVIPLVLWLNNIWGTNFWFLNVAAAGSPLTPIQNFAGKWYLPTLIICLGILWFFLYAPWALTDRKATKVEPVNS